MLLLGWGPHLGKCCSPAGLSIFLRVSAFVPWLVHCPSPTASSPFWLSVQMSPTLSSIVWHFQWELCAFSLLDNPRPYLVCWHVIRSTWLCSEVFLYGLIAPVRLYFLKTRFLNLIQHLSNWLAWSRCSELFITKEANEQMDKNCNSPQLVCGSSPFCCCYFFLKQFQVLVMEMNNFYFKFLYRCNIYGISL